MKCVLTTIALLLAFSTQCFAQVFCGDSSSVVIDTMSVTVHLSSSLSSGFSGLSGGSNLIIEAIVLRDGGGQVNYFLNVSTFAVTGGGSAIDAISTPDIFDMIASAAVAEGFLLGHTPCTTPCGSIESARVSQVACVDRIGSGEGTQFDPCGGGCCTRIYNVCCPDSLGPVITLIGSQSDGCGSQPYGCETTCPDEEESLSHALPVSHSPYRPSLNYSLLQENMP